MSAAGGPFRVTADRLAVRVPAGTVVTVTVIDLAGAGEPAIDELSAGSWGSVGPDPGRDIAKIAVIDPSSGTVRVGFAGGLGVQAGAVAVLVGSGGAGMRTAVAGAGAPSHLVVAGTSDRECAAAANALIEEALPVVVTVGARIVAREATAAETVLRDLGCTLASPLAALAGVGPEDLTPSGDQPPDGMGTSPP